MDDLLMDQVKMIIDNLPSVKMTLETSSIHLVSYRYVVYEEPYQFVLEFVCRNPKISIQEARITILSVLRTMLPKPIDKIQIKTTPFRTVTLE